MKRVRAYLRRANEASIEHVGFLLLSGPVIGVCLLIDYLFALQLLGYDDPAFRASEVLRTLSDVIIWSGMLGGYVLVAEEMCHRFPDEVKDDRVVRWVRRWSKRSATSRRGDW